MTPYTHVQTQVAVGTPHVLVLSRKVAGFASGQINDMLANIQQDRFNSISGDFATSELSIQTGMSEFHSDGFEIADTFEGEDAHGAGVLVVAPSSRAHGTIDVKLNYVGRGEPLPCSSPWED